MAAEKHPANRVAQQILEIVPCMMRAVALEMRRRNPLMMPVHFRLLGLLSRHPATLTELAERQAVSPPTMSKTVAMLEERGWVTRVRSETDRRVVIIQVTEAGRHALHETYQQAEEYLTSLLMSLEPAELESLGQGLHIMWRISERVISACHAEGPPSMPGEIPPPQQL
jgi:DNA-binding MarR family transcriptional regulator